MIPRRIAVVMAAAVLSAAASVHGALPTRLTNQDFWALTTSLSEPIPNCPHVGCSSGSAPTSAVRVGLHGRPTRRILSLRDAVISVAYFSRPLCDLTSRPLARS